MISSTSSLTLSFASTSASGWLVLAVLLLGAICHLSWWRSTSSPSSYVSGRVFVITGGARGIGLEMAKQLLQLGAKVAVLDVKQSALTQARDSLAEFGDDNVLLVQHCDVTDQQQVQASSEAIKEKFAPLTVFGVINNAAIVFGELVEEATDDQLTSCFDTNVFGCYRMLRQFLPEIKRRRSGHIVTMSSVVAFTQAPLMSSYCATKAAVWAMHNSLRLELRRENLHRDISTTIVHPFLTQTGMFEGVSLGLRWLVPPNSPASVASSIICGMANGKQTVYCPEITRYLCAIHRALPTCLQDLLIVISGGIRGMDNFVGRGDSAMSSKRIRRVSSALH